MIRRLHEHVSLAFAPPFVSVKAISHFRSRKDEIKFIELDPLPRGEGIALIP
jgi:hypothetical protein